MTKVNIKAFKKVTKIGAPVERTVKWVVEVTEENIDFLAAQLKRELTFGEKVELEGQVFIKKLAFNDLHEISKAYDWEINEDNIADSKLKSVSVKRMQAGHLLGSVCEDAKGTPFFSSVQDVLNSEIPFIESLYAVADEVNNFMGKSRKKNLTNTNSGASSSSESVESPSKKQSKK
ncbi:phage tail assembly chaperone family protein, TAC [Acinetobacter pittii]|uniref:Phage tail assembly chaperone family protein, TAC n=1 Tax=Acinetobacter pittii TaxID=48296 RepID=A0AAE9M8C7_ACIPI|nr:phage tail assembly chaperone family protein, TAC [Acinetobacter pittii]MBK0409601.1 phage tail assembly chaperone family protein, TAC [Acinetobacter pittii]MBK1417320.1 phage tail assembly chaperone family protein, TAC [Acinetobacter pittii]USU94131.1 phage tail assembly chaperone family protein, TAC [Acinetobacter pittii]